MWADKYIEQLQSGIAVKFRPSGKSMTGIINSGQMVTVLPFNDLGVDMKGRVVLCKVNGKQYLHKVLSTRADGSFQIGNNKGGVNGWTKKEHVYGLVVAVED